MGTPPPSRPPTGAARTHLSSAPAGTHASRGGAAGPRAHGDPAVVVRGLHKRYDTVEAVRGIDLQVHSGEIFGFLGPNGAGKSTTIQILCTLVRPTAGTARVAGLDVSRDPAGVRRRIGLVFHDPSLDEQLTARENLDFHAMLYGVARGQRRQRREQALALVDLSDRQDAMVRTFSGGMKRRLEIARGMLHAPEVLFLDEPTQGLDPQTRASIWAYLGELRAREGTTVFMTTHYLDEAEICDRLAIIDHGTIVAEGSPDQLKARVGGDVVTAATADDEVAAAELRDRLGVAVDRGDGHLQVTVADGAAFVPQLVGAVSVAVRSVAVRRPSLDDVFLQLTGRAIREEPPDPRAAWRARRGMGGGRR